MPIRSSTKIAGPTNRYLKLRSANAARAAIECEAIGKSVHLAVRQKRERRLSGAPTFLPPCSPTTCGNQEIRLRCLFGIGAGFRSPGVIHRLLLVDSHLLGYAVPIRSHFVQDRFRIFTCPQFADAL